MSEETPAEGFARYVAQHADRPRADRTGCGYGAETPPSLRDRAITWTLALTGMGAVAWWVWAMFG